MHPKMIERKCIGLVAAFREKSGFFQSKTWLGETKLVIGWLVWLLLLSSRFFDFLLKSWIAFGCPTSKLGLFVVWPNKLEI